MNSKNHAWHTQRGSHTHTCYFAKATSKLFTHKSTLTEWLWFSFLLLHTFLNHGYHARGFFLEKTFNHKIITWLFISFLFKNIYIYYQTDLHKKYYIKFVVVWLYCQLYRLLLFIYLFLLSDEIFHIGYDIHHMILIGWTEMIQQGAIFFKITRGQCLPGFFFNSNAFLTQLQFDHNWSTNSTSWQISTAVTPKNKMLEMRPPSNKVRGGLCLL